MVIHKRWLYEQKQTMLPSTFLACTRECKREGLKIIAGLKHIANEIRTELAKDAHRSIRRRRSGTSEMFSNLLNLRSRILKPQ